MSRLFSTSDFVSLAKNTTLLKEAESYLRENRSKFMPILQEHTTQTNARKLLRLNDVQVARLMCRKLALPEFAFGSNATEKVADRLSALNANWLKHVDQVLMQSQLFQKYGPRVASNAAEDLTLGFQRNQNFY